MKFQRIGTTRSRPGIRPLTRILALGAMLCAGAQLSLAADEDYLPPPGGTSAPSGSVPAEQLHEGDDLPDPSLGGEALPEPSADRGQESSSRHVNRPPENDEIFLPTPNVNDNVYYAPVGSPAPRVSADESDWRLLTRNRPMFSLLLGAANKSYINDQVKGRITGPSAGISIRLFDLGQTLFFHAMAGYSWFKPGDVLSLTGVKDEQLQYGGAVELGVGRRISLFASVLMRKSRVSDDKITPLKPSGYNSADALNIGDEGTPYLGLGAQYDFYVIPHGSLGVRAHVEMDLMMLTLSMAMEPRPRRKLSLNYDPPPND